MRAIHSISAVVITVLAACAPADQNPPATATPAPSADPCPRVETREANAPEQSPAFAGQTRACAVRSNVDLDVRVIATGLVHPWAVEPMPNGDLLVTERPGQMRIITAGGQVGAPIAGLPAVDARNQGGLLDVALSPMFESDRMIYWSYAEPRDGGNGTAVARGALSADARRVDNVQVIFRAMPTYNGTMHYGSRLAFDRNGLLFITTGERSDAQMRMHAQRLDNHLGKVMRIRPDGSVPQDNPFVGRADAAPRFGRTDIATSRRPPLTPTTASGRSSTVRRVAMS